MARRKQSTLDQVQSGRISRSLSLAAMGLKAGARLGSYSLTSLWASEQKKQTQRRLMLSDQAHLLVEELGRLKGSVMKAGQLLALYGDYLMLPPEVIEMLRTLQDDSPPLAWSALKPVLEKELSQSRLAELDVDPQPLAAASLGQVHRARRIKDGQELCIKLQYPGVADSIDSDLQTMGALLTVSRLLPKGLDLNGMLAEIRRMLHQEVDYQSEQEAIQRYRHLLQGDMRFRVPRVFPEYSTHRLLTTSYEPGAKVDGAEVRGLDQRRRNGLAAAALELFLRELFEWNLVQTDPHFGNYRVRLNPQSTEDQLILLDFGAVREYSENFRKAYCKMVRAAFWGDSERLERAIFELDFMPKDVSRATLEQFMEVCYCIVEPFQTGDLRGVRGQFENERGEYCWGQSDLPQRVTMAATRASFSPYFRLPPREFVFLHRKLGGVFVLLAELGAEFDARPLLLPFMEPPGQVGT